MRSWSWKTLASDELLCGTACFQRLGGQWKQPPDVTSDLHVHTHKCVSIRLPPCTYHTHTYTNTTCKVHIEHTHTRIYTHCACISRNYIYSYAFTCAHAYTHTTHMHLTCISPIHTCASPIHTHTMHMYTYTHIHAHIHTHWAHLKTQGKVVIFKPRRQGSDKN